MCSKYIQGIGYAKKSTFIFIFMAVVCVYFINKFKTLTVCASSRSQTIVACPMPGAGKLTDIRIKSTALVSWPGSGNTWVRHLLTTATGIVTASQYNTEEDISVHGMKGRAYRVITVKTHLPPNTAKRYFPVNRVILFIRNPYDAILAEFNRKSEPVPPYYGHTAIRSIDDFIHKWPTYVTNNMNGWENLTLAWTEQKLPMYVLIYDRLTSHLRQELENIIYFLNERSIFPLIHCAERNSEGNAHRKRPDWQNKMAVFSIDQISYFNSAIDSVRKSLEVTTGKSFEEFRYWRRSFNIYKHN